MDDNTHSEIIREMALQPKVKESVVKSHDDNPWWPKSVKDWRMRLIIGGLSTRVSFRMLPVYQKTITAFSALAYEDLKTLPNEELLALIKPLGLANTRIKFIRSMSAFIDSKITEQDLSEKPTSELIALIAGNVDGASYKVGQCCVLYAKGYYCGIMPVDSGMKDMLAPCLSFKTESSAYGHEVVRHQLEALAGRVNWRKVAEDTGYAKLVSLPENQPLTWWLHLVLINYKRHFCNNRDPGQCPVANKFNVCKSCAQSTCSR